MFTIFSTPKDFSGEFDLIQKNTSDLIDLWMYNFARNIPDFLNGNSVKQLSIFKNGKKSIKNHRPNSSAVVIGAGPSVKKNNHLEMLSNSNYKGAIVCTDRMLILCLKNGITPKKFPKFYVLTIEPKDVTLKFYNDPIVKKYHKGIITVLSTCTEHETVEVIKKNNLEILIYPVLFSFNLGEEKKINSLCFCLIRKNFLKEASDFIVFKVQSARPFLAKKFLFIKKRYLYFINFNKFNLFI